jgi:hypothetical protein
MKLIIENECFIFSLYDMTFINNAMKLSLETEAG